MKRILLVAILALALFGCEDGRRHSSRSHKKHKHLVVHTYKVSSCSKLVKNHHIEKEGDTDMATDLLFYLISSDDGAYFTTSSSPITNFSGVSWTKSPTIEKELEEEQVEELAETQVETQDVASNVQTEVEEEPDSFEDSSEDAGESSSDGGDGGGSGDGGGDGGGGDGGGGGGD